MDRVKAWRSWLMVPWKEMVLALALIGAGSAPAFLLAAADVWESAVGDNFVKQLLADETGAGLGVVVDVEGFFSEPALAEADKLVSERISEIPALDVPVRTLATFRSSGTYGPNQMTLGVPARLVARPGAVESLTVVENGPLVENGVWVSSWFAETREVRVGESISFESAAEPEEPEAEVAPGGGPGGDLIVVGIYEALWSDDSVPGNPYWAAFPDALMPQFLSVFNEPNFTLFITDEETLSGSGFSGLISWEAAAFQRPASLDEVRALDMEYRLLRTDFLRDEELTASLAAQARGRGVVPTVESRIPEALDQAEEAVAKLGQPLASARTAGIILGLAVIAAGAVFMVNRRRTEFRLLAAEGDRWPLLASRTFVQVLGPLAVGSLVGVAGGVLVATWFGPSSSLAFDVVDPAPVLWASLAGVMVVSLLTGLLGQRTLHAPVPPRGSTGLAFVIIAVVAASYVWIEVSQSPTRGAGAVDIGVVALPMVILVAAVAVAVTTLRRVGTFGGKAGARLPPRLYMAWRRITAADTAALLITGALAVGVGLIVFSTILVETLVRVTDVKVSAVVGSNSRVEVVGSSAPAADLPDGTTLISFQQSTLTPGDRRVKVLAVDTDTFSDGIIWPEEYGVDLETVTKWLETDGADLPVVSISGQGVAARSAYGVSAPVAFEVVGEVAGMPLASESAATILVSRSRLDAWELMRLATALGVDPASQTVQEAYRPPTEGFRHLLVSKLTIEEMVRFAETNRLTVREAVGRSDLLNSVDVQAPLLAFDYLRLLGFVAAASSFSALMLYLASRRRQNRVAAVIMQKMGLTPAQSAVITSFEVGGLTLLAMVAASIASPIVVSELLERFDPTPRLPPSVAVQVSAWTLFGSALLAVALVAVAVWAAERGVGASEQGRALRALD